MFKVRGAFTVTALSMLLLGGLIAPAIAQTTEDGEPCGPYTDVLCPEDENGSVDGTGDSEAPSEEETTEVDSVVITDDSDSSDAGAAASSDETGLGTVLARTGIDAWVLVLMGSLLLGGGVAVLAVRRRPATD